MKFPAPGSRTIASSVPMLFLLHLCLAFAVLGANPFAKQTITPVDVLIKQRAWSWMAPGLEPRDSERSDILNVQLPYWHNARQQIRAGEFPTWNDDAGGGTTLLVANYSMFTPAFLVFVAAPTPATGFHLAIVLNLALAGLGMHLFLRRHLGWLAASCGGATFMLCGFHAAWLYWPHVFTSIWAPWLLLAIDRCAAEPRMRNGLGIAAATAMVVLGGFPFVGEVILCMGGLYFVVLWARRWRATGDPYRFAAWYACGSLLGLLLCSLLLVEFVAWIQQFDIGYRENRGSYLDARYISRLLPPWSYHYKRVEQTMYVGAIMTVMAVVAAVATLVRARRAPGLPLFGVLLLAISSGLVFGLWPMWMIGWVPGMSFNSWSRAICILDIALIVLGACALDRAWTWARQRPSKILPLVVAAVAIVQVAEVAIFFHRYNGPVSSRFYYPEIPATRYLRQHAGPFDYVVSDRSFDISGELGAYGLRDWFAHGFRTPAQKRALDRMVPAHVQSHTASRFSARDIDTDSPLLADFNARYLVLSSNDPYAKRPGSPSGRSHEPLPPLPGHDWSQRFRVGEDGFRLAGISVRLATYQRNDIRGVVALSVQDAGGRTVARSQIQAAVVVDNKMAEFYFPRPVALPAGGYAFTLAYRPANDPPAALTAWASRHAGEAPSLLVDGAPHPGAIEYVLHEDRGLLGNFRRVQTAAGISIFENTNSPNGPYFLPRIDAHASRAASGNVRVGKYGPSAFELRYTGREPGYVVVPMSMTPEWSASIDGKPATIELKDGVMPAIRVMGPSAIAFDYTPMATRWLLPWAIALACVLGFMACLGRWLRGRQSPSSRARKPS